MYIDFKETIWYRVHFPDDKTDLIIQLLEKNREEEIYDHEKSSEYLFDTAEQLTVDENDGQPTIEVYNEAGVLLYDNVNGRRNENS